MSVLQFPSPIIEEQLILCKKPFSVLIIQIFLLLVFATSIVAFVGKYL